MACPDFIKLDCQGSELDILDGALEAMKCVKVILLGIIIHHLINVMKVNLSSSISMYYVEMSVARYNMNAPLATEVFAYMGNHGFDFFDFTEIHKDRFNIMTIQMDALFIRRTTPIFDNMRKHLGWSGSQH